MKIEKKTISYKEISLEDDYKEKGEFLSDFGYLYQIYSKIDNLNNLDYLSDFLEFFLLPIS